MPDWYCPLPFRHVFVDSTGISPCCITARQDVDLASWAEHPFLQGIQKSFLSGSIDQNCVCCLESEEKFGHSLRLDAVKDYGNEVFDELDIDFVDYRSNNICNFKCRSCDSKFSHGIAAEVKQYPSLARFYSTTDTKTVSVQDQNKKWILDHLPSLRRLMFTGGEPTIMPEVREIIQHVIDRNLDHIQIMITSNGSFHDDFWRQVTLTHDQLHWTLSIDAVGDASGIIRHGSDWPRIRDNLSWLAQHSRSLDVNTVISNLNVLQLKPLLQLVRSKQILSRHPTGRHGDLGLRHQFFICQAPFHMSATNWPDHLRDTVLGYLSSCLELDLDQEQMNTVKALRDQIIVSRFDQELWQRSQDMNLTLDQIRKQDHSLLWNPAYD